MVRHKTWAEYEKVYSDDLNKLAYNGVVEVDTFDEIAPLFDTLPDVNVLYCVEDKKLYVRGETEWTEVQPGAGAQLIVLSGEEGTGAATTNAALGIYNGNEYAVYTFNGNDTFEVLDPGVEVDLVVTSGGGGGAHQNGNHAAGNGGGGGTRFVQGVTLDPGIYTVNVGGAAGGWPNGNEGGRTQLVKDGSNLYNPRGGGGGGYTYNYGERTAGGAGGSGGGGGDGAAAGGGTPGEGQPGSGISGGGAGPTYGQGGHGSGLVLNGYRFDTFGTNIQFTLARQYYRSGTPSPANTGWGGSSGTRHDHGGFTSGSGVFVMRRLIRENV